MDARLVAIALLGSASLFASEVFAEEGRCAAPVPFHGFWGGGQVQVRERVAGVPVVATTRFSYRQMRYSLCAGGVPVLPPGIGEASLSVGVPLFDNRRGGWLLQVATQGQGAQRANEPVSGFVTGAPAMAGHLNLWETPLPLIQFTGAASVAILPKLPDVPLSIAYLGGVRVYALYTKHAQANLGVTIGGSNAFVNVVPSLAFRCSDLALGGYRMAIGFEVRSPIELSEGLAFRWRLWGALTLALDKIDEGRSDRAHDAQTRSRIDLARSSPEVAPPAQTAWETTL